MSKSIYKITINNQPFLGFKSFSIDTSFDSPDHSATVEYKNFSPEDEDEIGKSLKITYDGATIFEGFIFDLQKGYSEGETTYSLTARAKCADLVDSNIDKAPLFKKTSYKALVKLASDAFKAFSSIEFEPREFAPISADEIEKALPEEGAWDYIKELSRKRKLILYATPDNVLHVSSNILSLGYTHSLYSKERSSANLGIKSVQWGKETSSLFNKYSYVSESKAQGKKNSVESYGSVSDPSIRSTRINTANIRIENNVSLARDKINWKRSQLAASALGISLSVYDFVHPKSGILYKIGDYISYEDDLLGISNLYLISSCKYAFSETESYTCELTLKSPEAFLPEPPDEITKKQIKRRVRRGEKSKRSRQVKNKQSNKKTTSKEAKIRYANVSISQLRNTPSGGGL
jgi:prophage tail gpP-like protein